MARSIIGFHYSIGGNKNGIGNLIERMNQKGIPILLKGVDDAGLCHEGQTVGEKHGVDNWLIYRLSKSGQAGNIDYDVPDYKLSPKEAAAAHWRKTKSKWLESGLDKRHVWMEPINEPRAKRADGDTQWDNLHATDWLGWFMLEFAQIANDEGFKVCGPSFNAGEPEVFTTNDFELPGMLAYLKYCADHPDMAALSIHEYIWDLYKPEKNQGWDDWYPSLWGRVEAAFKAADRHNIPRAFPIFVTEWGFAHKHAPRWPEAKRYLDLYNEWAARWPQIKGVAAWTLQSGWGGVDNDIQSWLDPLVDYSIHSDFDPGEQPAVPHEKLFISAKESPQSGTHADGFTAAPVTSVGGVPLGHSITFNNPSLVSGEAPLGSMQLPDVVGVSNAESAGFSANVDLTTTDLVPGETLYCTWTFKNIGETTWDQRFNLVYVDQGTGVTSGITRSPLSRQTRFPITEIGAPASVPPGASASLTVPLQVPLEPGQIASHWQLEAPDGGNFGPVRWVYDSVLTGRFSYQYVAFTNSRSDFRSMPAGSPFTGTWTLRNNGTLPWSGDMRIAYVDASLPDTSHRNRSTLGHPESITLRELSGLERVRPGNTVTIAMDFKAPKEAGSYAFHWQMQTPSGQPLRGTRWMILDVARANIGPAVRPVPKPPMPTPITGGVGTVEFGVNINPNPGEGDGREIITRDIDIPNQRGLGWVRYVYWASRNNRSPKAAYNNRYQEIIQTYAEADIKSLLILHQDTFWGHAPWDNGQWGAYASQFAAACADVARACLPFKDKVAYQIFNETDSGFGDDAPFHNKSAIGIPPKAFALILKAAVKAIRTVDPDATIVLGGLKTGPQNAINYLKQVQRRLGGRLPVDALAYHPYGRYVNLAPFNYAQIGKLADALQLFKNAYPNLPVWITEIGVPGHATVLGPEHYETIATYMQEVVAEIKENHAGHVPVVTWFAWSDMSENSGIFTAAGNPKAHIVEAYQGMKAV